MGEERNGRLPDTSGDGEKEMARKAASGGFLLVCIVFISFTLRGPITAVGPQVSAISEELGASGSLMGLITTLPPLAFGFFSPFVGSMGKRLGIPRTILFALLAILAGLVIRCSDGVGGLFGGTVLMGLGIAVGNVMIPSIIRKWFPGRVGTMTSVYTTAMGIFAALGAGASIPMSLGLGWGWRGALGIWAVPALAALLMWLIQMRKGEPAVTGPGDKATVETAGTTADREPDGSGKAAPPAETGKTAEANRAGGRPSVWTSGAAWCITIFMGLQSLLFYSTSSWMPTIVQARGVSPEGASLLALVFQAAGIAANMATAVIYNRTRNQSLLGSGIAVAFVFGLSGMLFVAPSGAGFALGAVLLGVAGLASGASLSWILTTIGVMGRDAAETADLSGMAQSVGYLLAAVGPALSGILYDLTGMWSATALFYLAVGGVMAVFGLLVGKNKTLFAVGQNK